MELGLKSGLSIYAVADHLVARLVQAGNAALAGDIEALCDALTACATRASTSMRDSAYVRI